MKKRKKTMHDNLDDEQKQQLKTEDNKIKKPKHDNRNVDEKEQMKIYKKNMKESYALQPRS